MLAVDYLAVDYMSPQLRSAFYEVMRNIPGTELIGPVDVGGRRGIAIGYTRDGVRDEVIFDRKTGDVLSIRTVRLEPADLEAGPAEQPCCSEMAWAGITPGTVMMASEYKSDRVMVDSIEARR
jgi:hypothetical protein